MVGHNRLVVVSVTVVTEVLIVVVVDGAGASVVVTGAVVVVGATVVVGVAVGDTVTVWVVGAGSGAADCVVLGAADEVADGDDVVLVPAGVEESGPTNFTTAYTSRARIAALSTPRPTSAAGFWYHGVGGGGGGVCPYPVGSVGYATVPYSL